MSAPDQITPPVVARYGEVLDALRPGTAGDERRQRCGILYLRDRATAALRIAGWEAAQVLHVIVQLATVHGLGSMTSTELETLHASITRLFSVATTLEQCGPQETKL